MRVILRPIRQNSWSGLVKYRNCYTDLAPYYTRSGRVYTGLTKNDEERLSSLLGLDLTSGSDFWKEFFIRTGARDIYLHLEDPMDELRYLFLKNHKRVKNSIFEHKASADFLLLNKDEEAKKSNIINRTRREAMKEFDKMSSDDIRKCLRLYGNNADSMSNEVAENRLYDIVEANPKSFLERWVHNKSRDTEYIIERAISRNIIRKSKNIYKYGTDVIGHTMTETIDFLENPKNQDIKIAIIKAIESKQMITLDEPLESTEQVEIKGKSSEVLNEEEVEKKEAQSKKKSKEDTI